MESSSSCHGKSITDKKFFDILMESASSCHGKSVTDKKDGYFDGISIILALVS
jgi:hypothetical protein